MKRINGLIGGERGALAAVLIAGAVPIGSACGQQATLRGLGVAGDAFSSWASGVSPDGRYVCGNLGSLSGAKSFRWTVEDGMVLLPNLSGAGSAGGARGVSNDGRVVGRSYNGTSGFEGFVWTPQDGRTLLGDFLSDGFVDSEAIAISADGTVIAGVGSLPVSMAARWVEQGQPAQLGDLAGGRDRSVGLGVSDDGMTIVGYSNTETGDEAFRWTEQGGMVGLGDLPGGPRWSWAYDANSDGSVIVGISKVAATNHVAFRWTQATGMQNLGDLPGGAERSYAYGVSEDGRVIAGFGDTSAGAAACLWIEGVGMRSLWDILLEQGVDPADDGWEQLTAAYGLSSDGRTVVGEGVRNGLQEAFLAVVGDGCSADFNRDGFVDFFDYLDFVTCFETSVCPVGRSADFNGDAFVDFFDYSGFVEAFTAGC